MSFINTPIPLSEIEAVMAWVDTFKLSRPTRKINRDFSDAVLLAEMLAIHYPKLVDMHNYPPRNSHALKLNNWMTLNRKVLRRLKLNLCTNTMEQLSNSVPGVIDRVLYMVRDKIRRDEELNRASKEENQQISSAESYYEACGDEQILVVPVKTRVNGVLETIQRKVISYDVYNNMKVELTDAKESVDTLKHKVDHLDSMIKLKDERIDELQKQLERKQTRRKETESQQSNTTLPVDLTSLDNIDKPKSSTVLETIPTAKPFVKIVEPSHEVPPTAIPVSKTSVLAKNSLKSLHSNKTQIVDDQSTNTVKTELLIKYGANSPIRPQTETEIKVDTVRSDVFKEAEQMNDEIFKDTEPTMITIEDTIQNEINSIASNPQEPLIINNTKSAINTAVD